MDTSVLMENKLRLEWSAPDFTPYLSAARLSYASKEFPTLNVGIKLRLLLSLLSMNVKQLRSLWSSIQGLLEVAQNDEEEWVKVVLALVRQRLPPLDDVGSNADASPGAKDLDPSQSSSQTTQDQTQPQSQMSEDATQNSQPDQVPPLAQTKKRSSSDDPEEDADANNDAGAEAEAGAKDAGSTSADVGYLEYSLQEVFKALGPAARKSPDGKKDSMWPEYVPFEWPYLCNHLRPEGVTLEESNRHFTPVGVPDGKGHVGPSSEQGASTTEGAESTKLKIKFAPLPGAGGGAAGPKLTVKLTKPKEAPQQAGGPVPASILGVLNNPANDKLTEQSRAQVLGFYSRTTSRPENGIELILLNETRQYVDNNTALEVAQTQLKLNHDDRTAKRVKNKKKYKLKT